MRASHGSPLGSRCRSSHQTAELSWTHRLHLRLHSSYPGVVIPVIDLFAGPGGLSEGFSAFRDKQGCRTFGIALSVEKDPVAHQTLRLRAFVRQFEDGPPEEYYDFVQGNLTLEALYRSHPDEFAKAKRETLRATLGSYSSKKLDSSIHAAIRGQEHWVLIGGPPCQAYSLVGRSRMKNSPDFSKDKRHFLYREYLRIIAAHRPPIFVMENVKGMLSSKVSDGRIMTHIMEDLQQPLRALPKYKRKHQKDLTYELVPLGTGQRTSSGRTRRPQDFIVRCEQFGIAQARHRVILIGIRSDVVGRFRQLQRRPPVSMWRAIEDLPQIRSRISTGDSYDAWLSEIRKILECDIVPCEEIPQPIRNYISSIMRKLNPPKDCGSEYIPGRLNKAKLKWERKWFHDSKLGGVLNHTGRGHMAEDLRRYFFAACFAKLKHRSPKLDSFPRSLWPKHRNVLEAQRDKKVIFDDRFRVQVREKPASTVTSHISKDGHYFIHPDPNQCRSLTVREAARLQTFPDNYFFAGPRTEQYHQVGNAVPPLLARAIAEKVYETFERRK